MLWYIGSGEYSGGCIGSDAWREAAVAHSFAGSFTLWKRRHSFVGLSTSSISASITRFFSDSFSGLVLNHVDIN